MGLPKKRVDRRLIVDFMFIEIILIVEGSWGWGVVVVVV